MTIPQKNSNLAPWKWALIGAGSTVLLGLDGLGFWNSINPQTFPSSVATAITQNSVAKKLIGRWQIQVSGQSFILIFTQEGKLFLSNSATSLMELEYRTDVNRQPKYLDLLVGNQVIARTIFDLTADDQLRLELDNIGESRPTSFSSNAKVFRKISEQTALPANLTVVNLEEQQKRARQAKAKNYVGMMNQAQRAVYAETNSFTSSIEKLQLGMKSEIENYFYSIILSNNNRFVQSIALPKIDGLRNYIGIVYLVKSASGEPTTSSILCQSNQPSKKLPGSPVFNSRSNLQCPVGYSQIN
ncbi:type IV pilin-like G/H family protein [Microcoleus sp. A006_D1]|uniref:type IV pilin-like G/H family protein n=1 Tax=Microcoleus sp. A006_D1 TaxID=3055267 RepID=UPI002FCE9154